MLNLQSLLKMKAEVEFKIFRLAGHIVVTKNLKPFHQADHNGQIRATLPKKDLRGMAEEL